MNSSVRNYCGGQDKILRRNEYESLKNPEFAKQLDALFNQ